MQKQQIEQIFEEEFTMQNHKASQCKTMKPANEKPSRDD
jgi:hypothetical protein